jgi:hypothetical protein
LSCRYLAAKCLAEVDEWDECLTLLGDGELDDDLQDAVRTMLLSIWRQLRRLAAASAAVNTVLTVVKP